MPQSQQELGGQAPAHYLVRVDTVERLPDVVEDRRDAQPVDPV